MDVKSNMNRWLVLFVAILIVGGGWLWWSRPPAAAATVAQQGPGVGRAAPDFTLPLLEDGEGDFRLSEHQGKPLVVNFWATWCGPCQRELPVLQKAATHFGDSVVFVGVNQEEATDTVERFVRNYGLTYAIPMDTHGEVAAQYNVRGLPTTLFIDRNGVIRSVWLGEMNSVTLAENVAKIQ